MSGEKAGAKALMGISIATAFFSGWTHSAAMPVLLFAWATLGLAALAVIIGGAGYEKGEDTLAVLIIGGIITLGAGIAIVSALGSSQSFFIQWIVYEVGAIIFLCY